MTHFPALLSLTQLSIHKDQIHNSMTTTSKRHKLNHDNHHPLLIPGLPDDIAQLCLSQVNPFILFSICHSWRRLIYSPSFPPFLSLYAILSPQNTPFPPTHYSQSIQLHNFDPISNTWHPLPPPPPDPPLHHLVLRHPSFLSRNFPIQSTTVAGNLILLAATTHNLFPALTRPLIFNPVSENWTFGPSLATPRRWCALGACRGAVYVASGMGTQFSNDVARSLEKWDPNNEEEWEKKREMKDGRFSREAIDAVGWKGKVCLVNVKGDAAKEGVVYHVDEDAWKDMPEGMLSGWRGPVAAMEEEVMYVVDERKGALRKYVEEEDAWEEVMVDSERLIGAEQVVAQRGKVCVVSRGGKISVVDVAVAPPRLWVVDLPHGFEAVAVHILPRMPVRQ